MEHGLHLSAALKQPSGYTTGIYFGLPDTEYHADCALSHSGIVKLLNHPYDYWVTGPLNTHRKKPRSSPAMEFGKRCHAALLTPDVFKKEWRHPSEPYTANRKTLNVTEWEDIEESLRMLKPTREKFLRAGYPEVSIFWIDPESRLRCRIRVDYLRVFGGIDYKRTKDVRHRQLGWTIAEFGYDIQEAFYLEGIAQIKQALRENRATISGEHDPAWIKAFTEEPDVLFMFIFQRSERPYVFDCLEMEEEIKINAKNDIYFGKKRYLEWLGKYGTDEWPAGDSSPKEFSIHHLPSRIYYRGGDQE